MSIATSRQLGVWFGVTSVIGGLYFFTAKQPLHAQTKMATGEKNPKDWKLANSVYDFTANDIKGHLVDLEKYKGHPLLIVNVASKCGYTDNHYAELNELHDLFEPKGLRILAFPCNQFGSQEPGGSDDICSFTAKKNVKFELFEKVKVNGDDAHPLWIYLRNTQKGTLMNAIKWNFTKFLIDRNGKPVARHPPTTSPKKMIPEIEKLINE